MTEAQARTFTVTEDDDGIRLDRWFKRNLPEASFNIVSRWARTGQLRVNGKRATPGDRIEAGQEIRVPSAETAPSREGRPQRKIEPLTDEEAELVREMVTTRDPHAFVLAKLLASLRRAGPRPISTSTGCLTGSPTKAARGPNWSIGSTRTPPGHCWWREPPARQAISQRPLQAALRARSIGRWSSACPRPTKA